MTFSVFSSGKYPHPHFVSCTNTLTPASQRIITITAIALASLLLATMLPSPLLVSIPILFALYCATGMQEQKRSVPSASSGRYVSSYIPHLQTSPLLPFQTKLPVHQARAPVGTGERTPMTLSHIERHS